MRALALAALALTATGCGRASASEYAVGVRPAEVSDPDTAGSDRVDAAQGDLDARFEAAFFRHYLVGEQAVALAEFRRLAAADHRRSAEMLAVAYTHGEGVEADAEEAARWLARAAALGSRRAARDLAAVRARRS